MTTTMTAIEMAAARERQATGPRCHSSRILQFYFGLIIISSPAHAEEPVARGGMVTRRGSLESFGCELERSISAVRYRGCAISCQQADNVVGLLDSDGNFFVLLDPESGGPYADAVRWKGRTVSVTGSLVEESGFTSVIYVWSLR